MKGNMKNGVERSTHAERYNRIAEKIRSLRKEKNWSQEELSKKSGVSRVSISNIENPDMKKTYSLLNLFKIADALGVDAETLL